MKRAHTMLGFKVGVRLIKKGILSSERACEVIDEMKVANSLDIANMTKNDLKKRFDKIVQRKTKITD